jgi:hypothetical protein
MRRIVSCLAVVVALSACSTERQTNTQRSPIEELMLSAAADRAAQKMVLTVSARSKVFLDTSLFETAVDGKYAIGSIRDSLLRQGLTMADSQESADVVISVRSGALATGNNEFLIGSPAFNIPIPLAGPFSIPKIALYDSLTLDGVAKFAATAVDRKTGRLVVSLNPQYGRAARVEHTVLFLITWTDQDFTDPKKATSE